MYVRDRPRWWERAMARAFLGWRWEELPADSRIVLA